MTDAATPASAVPVQDDGACLHLVLPATRDALEPARQRVLQFLAPHAPGPKTVFDVELILEETLMNVVLHAFPAGVPGTVELTVRAEGPEIVLQFEDGGVEFDPLQASFAPAPDSIDDAVPGGLGLVLVRKLARSVAYERRDARNRLTLRLARR